MGSAFFSRFLRNSPLVALAILLLANTGVLAQERFSNIVGTVTDASKAVLPGVLVTVTNNVTSRSLTATTGPEGKYHIREVEPGRYMVQFELKGFCKFEIADAQLLLGRTINVDATLLVGGPEDTVVVADAKTAIDLGATLVAHNVTEDEFGRIPKSRSFQDLAITSPSVNAGQIEGGIQVNGASSAENNFNVDGLSITGIINGNSRQDALYEFLQEVQVKTSGMEAEYGGALGGVISAVTKSGGNQYHGEIHWYNYGSNWDAAPPERLQTDPIGMLNNKYIQDNDDRDHNNEFGGSIGGPILKDRLFFFTGFSSNWRRQEQNPSFYEDNNATSEFKSKQNSLNMFNKLSWNPAARIRTNFSWLYTVNQRTGYLPGSDGAGYDGFCPNCIASSASSFDYYSNRGWYQPQNSYSASMDFILSSTSVLSLRGGYFWDKYYDRNVPMRATHRYYVSTIGMEGIPEGLQHPYFWQDLPSTEVSRYDITSRGFYMADYSKTFGGWGTHNLKGGAGYQKLVNTAYTNLQGDYRIDLYWGRTFSSPELGPVRGQYGYYRARNLGTQGSAGSGIWHMYLQDMWQIHPRLTLNLGLRTEQETLPSFNRDIQKQATGHDYAIKFGFEQKLAPRLGASFDLFGDRRVKIFGSWGRYFDWTKYELVRGSFGGDIWTDRYRALDTLDIFSINGSNLVGSDIWYPSIPDSFRDYRTPIDNSALDPDLKPMFVDNMVIGTEFQFNPRLALSAHYVRSRLTRTIEDIGRLDETGSEVYTIGNPGEGLYKIETNHYGATPDFPMPKPVRRYDALELSLVRRFSNSWFIGANYTWSRLFGNYAGLSSTDEVSQGGLGQWNASQTSAWGVGARPGGNANRDYDSDEILFDSHGKFLMGPLETERPHVFKAYGSYLFKWGTEVGGRFYIGSGTPVTTRVENFQQVPIMVEGRGNAGRTATLSQTDLMVSHEFNLAENKRIRLEFNMMNLFNQKTERYVQNIVTRYRDDSAAIDMSGVNLLNGYDWRYLLSQTLYAQNRELTSDPNSLDPAKNWAVDPSYGKTSVFNPGFSGRFSLKFIF